MRRIRVTASAFNKTLSYGSIRGAQYSSTPITTAAPLATAYNPSAPVLITDNGLAYATNMDDGAAGTTPCLIFNRPVVPATGGTFGNILTFDLPEDSIFLAWRQVAIPVTGNLFVLAWEAYWA